MLKSWKEKLIAIGIAILFLLFNIYVIKTFLVVESQMEPGRNYLLDVFDTFGRVSDRYAMYFFIVSGISAIFAIVLGSFIEVESVGAGLMGGGILLLIYGGLRYWWYAGNKTRVVMLGIALAILVYIGLKKFGNKEAKKSTKK